MNDQPDPRAANAIKDGLFTRREFVLPDEFPEYVEFRTGLLGCLNPQSPLEQNYAEEIVTSHWRLRRCRLLEAVLVIPFRGASLSTRCDENFFLSPEDEHRQKSVDRARAQAQNSLRKASAELRKIQTERECRVAYTFGKDWGLAESAKAFNAFKGWRKEQDDAQAAKFNEFKEMLERELGPLPPAEEGDEDEEADSSLFCIPDRLPPLPTPFCFVKTPHPSPRT